jgi:hypothetical protein
MSKLQRWYCLEHDELDGEFTNACWIDDWNATRGMNDDNCVMVAASVTIATGDLLKAMAT